MTEKLELPDGYVVVCVHCAKELNIEFDEPKPLSVEDRDDIIAEFLGDYYRGDDAIHKMIMAVEERGRE